MSDYKSKAEVKASQENKSQDTVGASIPVIDGLEPSLEKLYSLNRGEAHRLTQTVKVAAYRDEFSSAIAELEKGLVSPSFFESLQKSYIPVIANQSPMQLLTLSCGDAEAKDNDAELDAMCERNDHLHKLNVAGNITPEELEELVALQEKLKELGAL